MEIYDNNKDRAESERDVCRVFIEPLFEALDWNVRSLDEVKEQKNQPQGRPDYIFYLNGSIAFYLETKKFKALDEDDIKQALNYARNNGKRWAVLSNFEETIVLICDTEEDSLQKHIFRHILNSELETNIDDLLLLSRESFKNGIIDKKAEEEGRVKKTIKPDEELLDDILKWRDMLERSINKNNQTKYEVPILEEIVQVLLNRIIFIRTAEDRKKEAEPDDTIKSFLNVYEQFRRIIIKNRVNRLFEEYDRIYDSKLFTQDENNFKVRHICEEVNIDNKTYYKLLKGTYDKNKIYSYRFDAIDVDILGQMYEKYIANIQKKGKGVYYTPQYITEFIANQTLKYFLHEKRIKKEGLDKIKVLDLACGSGSFLLKAFNVLDDYLAGIDKEYAQSKLSLEDSHARISKKSRLLKNNIFGVDLDTKAVEIANLNLLLKIAEDRYKLPDLRENIQTGNSIIDINGISDDNMPFGWETRFPNIIKFDNNKNLQTGYGFDVIIGNPPWISFGLRNVGKLSKAEDSYYRNQYASAQYKLSTYAIFLERAIRLTKEGGKIGYILPDSFLMGRYFSNLRRFILDSCKIKTILITFYDVFSDKATTGRDVIILLEKCKDRSKRINNTMQIMSVDSENSFKKQRFKIFNYRQNYFENTEYNRFRLFFNKPTMNLVTKLENDTIFLGEIIDINSGLIGKGGKASIISDTKRNDKWLPAILSGGEINRYVVKPKGKYILYDKSKIHSGYECVDYFSEKLFLRQTGDSLICAYDNKGLLCLNNVHVANLKDANYSLKYVMALLNSSVLNYYYRSLALETGRVMAQTDIETLEKLPIKAISKDRQKPFIELADKLIEINVKILKLGEETNEKRNLIVERDRFSSRLDELVYELYGISNEEDIKIIKEVVDE